MTAKPQPFVSKDGGDQPQVDGQKMSPSAGTQFQGKTFYLDLRTHPQIRNDMVFGITSLGGRIDDFLSNSINYIVTDKPENQWPKKVTASEEYSTDPNQPSTSKSTRLQTIRNAVSYATIASNTFTKPTTDILEKAIRFDPPIKLVTAARMMDHLLKHVVFPNKQKRTSSVLVEETEQMKSIKAVPLTGPFIKIESQDRKHRPAVRVFKQWPELVAEQGQGCPFKNPYMPNRVISKEAQARVDEVKKSRITQPPLTNIHHHQLVNQRQHNQKHQQIVYKPFQKVTPTTSAVVTTSTITTNSPIVPILSGNAQSGTRGTRATGFGNTRGTIPGTTSLTTTPRITSIISNTSTVKRDDLQAAAAARKVTAATKRKALLFCEICGVEYDDLNGHIMSSKHQAFCEDMENFKDLISVIRSIPTIEDVENEAEAEMKRERMDLEEEEIQHEMMSSEELMALSSEY